MRPTRLLAVVASVAMLGGLAACSSAADEPQSAASSDGPIKIGVALPLSGPLAAPAAVYKTVYNAIGKGLPGTDTIDGRKVEVVMRDTLGTAAGSSAAVRQLLDQDSVDLILGPLYTSEAEAAMPLVAQAKKMQVVLSGCGTCGDASKYPNVFAVEADRPTQMPSTVEWIKQSGTKKVAVLAATDAGGKGYSDAFTEEAKKDGLDVVKTVTFAPSSLDLGAQVAQLKDSGADGVYIASAVPLDVTTALKAMKQAGYQPAIFGNAALAVTDVTNAINDPAWFTKWAASGAGLNSTAPDVPKASVEARDSINKVMGVDSMALNFAQYGSALDAFSMVKAAIEGSKSTNADTMTDWLVKNGYNGTKTKYTFTDTQHNGMTADSQLLVQPGTFENGILTRVGAPK